MITPTIVFSTPIAGKNSVHKGSLIDNDANKVTRHKSPVLYWEYLTTGFKILLLPYAQKLHLYYLLNVYGNIEYSV